MDTKYKIKDLNFLILCGGLGTRLKPVVSDRPKVLAQIKDKTFLDILLSDLINQGAKKFIFCVGYLKDMIQNHVVTNYPNIETIFSVEDVPLGTGGAIKNALSKISDEIFIVVNGDTFCKISYQDLLDSHQKNNAFLTMALSKPQGRQDAGNVQIDKNQRIINFKEKEALTKSGFINAGIYIMQKNIQNFMPNKNIFSLENDIFPQLIHQNSYGFLVASDVIDIGTVERYHKAQEIL